MLARAAYRKFLGGGSSSSSNTPKAEDQASSKSNSNSPIAVPQNNLNEDMSASAEDFKVYTRPNDYLEHESYTVMNIDENERFDHKNNSWSHLNLLPSDPSRYITLILTFNSFLNLHLD